MKANIPPMLPRSPKSLPKSPCLSRSGPWLFFAALRRAFTKWLVMLGVAAEFELEPPPNIPGAFQKPNGALSVPPWAACCAVRGRDGQAAIWQMSSSTQRPVCLASHARCGLCWPSIFKCLLACANEIFSVSAERCSVCVKSRTGPQ